MAQRSDRLYFTKLSEGPCTFHLVMLLSPEILSAGLKLVYLHHISVLVHGKEERRGKEQPVFFEGGDPDVAHIALPRIPLARE